MEIINQTTGEVVDINKMTNDQLASEYRNYQKESQFARTMWTDLRKSLSEGLKRLVLKRFQSQNQKLTEPSSGLPQ